MGALSSKKFEYHCFTEVCVHSSNISNSVKVVFFFPEVVEMSGFLAVVSPANWLCLTSWLVIGECGSHTLSLSLFLCSLKRRCKTTAAYP